MVRSLSCQYRGFQYPLQDALVTHFQSDTLVDLFRPSILSSKLWTVIESSKMAWVACTRRHFPSQPITLSAMAERGMPSPNSKDRNKCSQCSKSKWLSSLPMPKRIGFQICWNLADALFFLSLGCITSFSLSFVLHDAAIMSCVRSSLDMLGPHHFDELDQSPACLATRASSHQ